MKKICIPSVIANKVISDHHLVPISETTKEVCFEEKSYLKSLSITVSRGYQYVGKSFLDFFSIGHFFMGYMIFLISYYIMMIWFDFSNTILYIGFSIAILIELLWELLENRTLVNKNKRMALGRDSNLNIVSDVLFCSLGAFIAILVDSIILHVIIIVVLSIFSIFWYLWLKRKRRSVGL